MTSLWHLSVVTLMTSLLHLSVVTRMTLTTAGDADSGKQPLPLYCGDPPVMLGARPLTFALTFTFPAVTNYSCLPDMHYVRGTTSSQCLRNGSWTLPTILCSSRHCFYWRAMKAVYSGDAARTQSGQSCQAWTSQDPHQHTRDNLLQFETDFSIEEIGSRCRDPDGEAIPWCYTTNPSVRWEVCNVPTCLKETCGEPPAIFGASVTFNLTLDPYTAIYSCVGDYVQVRGDNTARCLFDGAWTLPSLLCVPTDCYRQVSGQALYAGNVSETRNGSACQRWDQQAPHAHNFRQDRNFLADGNVSKAGNSCRDPSGSGRPWCYADSEQLFWDFCDVPECPEVGEEDVGCGAPPDVDKASVFHTSTAEGATAYYRCLHGNKTASGETNVAVCKSGIWVLPPLSCPLAPTSPSTTTDSAISYKVETTSKTTSTHEVTTPIRASGRSDVTAYVSLATLLGVLVPTLVLLAVLLSALGLHLHRKMKRRGETAFSNAMYLDTSVSDT